MVLLRLVHETFLLGLKTVSSHGSLLCVHTEKDVAVVFSSSCKDTGPRGLGPHPYDLILPSLFP